VRTSITTTPQVSVVIPTYKHDQYILQSLDSVFEQTFADYEIIVVNDGSPDTTAHLLKPLADNGSIRYFDQPNAGQSVSRNRGIAEARGEFIALLDDDDFWPKDKLEWQVAELREHPQAVVVYGCVTTFGAPPFLTYPGSDAPQGWVGRDFLRAGWIRSPGQALISADAFRRVGGFDTRIWGTDDWDLWLRLARLGEFRFVQRPALYYRQHPSNASKSVWRMYVNARRVQRKNVGCFPHPGNWKDWFASRRFIRLFCGHDASFVSKDALNEGQRRHAVRMWLLATWLCSTYKMPMREFLHRFRNGTSEPPSVKPAATPTSQEMSDEEIGALAPKLHALLKSSPAKREVLQRCGVNVVPVHFYSTVPSLEEIRSSYEYASSPQPPYLNEQLFDAKRLGQVLAELSEYAHEFNPPVEGDEQNCNRFFWKNGQFSHSDAMAYYCFVRRQRPRNIVEIGSGFSTLVALEAVKRNGFGKVICIEPYPRPFLEKNRDIHLIRQKAQDIAPSFVDHLLRDGDILFIDSTHTVKTGGDCLHIYLRLLPRLGKTIYVHAHDIFLPFGMPENWLLERGLYWTEQYLLLAFLLDNPKAQALYGSNYHNRLNNPTLEQMMANKWTAGGGSFWFEYNGSGSVKR